MQFISDVLRNGTLEAYVVLLTNDTSINLIKIIKKMFGGLDEKTCFCPLKTTRFPFHVNNALSYLSYITDLSSL